MPACHQFSKPMIFFVQLPYLCVFLHLSRLNGELIQRRGQPATVSACQFGISRQKLKNVDHDLPCWFAEFLFVISNKFQTGFQGFFVLTSRGECLGQSEFQIRCVGIRFQRRPALSDASYLLCLASSCNSALILAAAGSRKPRRSSSSNSSRHSSNRPCGSNNAASSILAVARSGSSWSASRYSSLGSLRIDLCDLGCFRGTLLRCCWQQSLKP